MMYAIPETFELGSGATLVDSPTISYPGLTICKRRFQEFRAFRGRGERNTRGVNLLFTNYSDRPESAGGKDSAMPEHIFATHFEKIKTAFATDAALSKLDMYRNLEDGWQGPDSLAPSRRAFVEAETFIEKLVNETGGTRGFLIGVDSDGEIVFSWNDDGVVGNLAIPGNNKYFYFIKSRLDGSIASGAAIISEPLNSVLSNILSRN